MSSRLLILVAGAALALPAGAQMRYTRNQAVQTCESNIRQQAMDRFGANDIAFPRINTSSYGRGGSVSGMVRVGEGQGAEWRHFSCDVNFATGYVRSARLEGGGNMGEAGRDVNVRAMERCQSTVADRIRDQGYSGIQFNSTNLDADGVRVVGSARAQGDYYPESFSFSCSIDQYGNVRGTSLTRR